MVKKNYFGVLTKSIKSNNVKDYFNRTLSLYCLKKGINHKPLCFDLSQQNRVAERKNGYLLNVTRAFLYFFFF